MRAIVLTLFVIFWNSHADFSLQGVKNWLSEMYDKGSAYVGTGFDKLKSSSAAQKMGNLLDQTKDTLRDNRSGTITPELLERRKNFIACAEKLRNELDADIRSLSQLKNIRFHDRIVIYKNGKHYVQGLEACLSQNIENFAETRSMKKEVDGYMDHIFNILTDELIYSYVADLRDEYRAFNNAFEDLERNLKNSQ